MRSMVEGRRDSAVSLLKNARFARAPPPHFVRSPSPAKAGEDLGSSNVQSHRLALTQTGRTSTPCSRASRTSWAGRRSPSAGR